MMPIARAAELHSQLREPIKEDFTVFEDQSGEHAEAGNTSIVSTASIYEGGCGLSREGQTILHSIEASARDWSRMQTMLQLEKEHIVDIARCVFDKVDSQSQGCLPWPNLGEAMLLLCGKHFSEMEVAALCKHHMFAAGSELSKVQFQEVAFDALFLVAQEELRNGDTVNNAGLPRCAQRLRFLRMDLCSHESFGSPAVTHDGEGPVAVGARRRAADVPELAFSATKETLDTKKTVTGRPVTKRQQGRSPSSPEKIMLRRAPIMMPQTQILDLACFGRSLG